MKCLVTCALFSILFWTIPSYFKLWKSIKLIVAEMHRSHGGINRETSGNLSPTGLIQNDSGSVSEAQSCPITSVSKSLLANKTMYKHKWKQTLTYKCTHMLTEAYTQTHKYTHIGECAKLLSTWVFSTYWSSSYLIHTEHAHFVQTPKSARKGHTHEYAYSKCTDMQNTACYNGRSH